MTITSGYTGENANDVTCSRAAHVLASAFEGDPLMRFAIADHRRRRAMQWLFRRSVEYGVRCGQVLCERDARAVAIWFGPVGTNFNVSKQLKAAMLVAPMRFGFNGLRRLRAFDRVREQLHQHCIQVPHSYLFAVGVHPVVQGRGLAAQVIVPMLRRADRQGLPCYLETTNDRNLQFFKKFGFEPAMHERMTYSGGHRLNIWAMVREPDLDRHTTTPRLRLARPLQSDDAA